MFLARAILVEPRDLARVVDAPGFRGNCAWDLNSTRRVNRREGATTEYKAVRETSRSIEVKTHDLAGVVYPEGEAPVAPGSVYRGEGAAGEPIPMDSPTEVFKGTHNLPAIVDAVSRRRARKRSFWSGCAAAMPRNGRQPSCSTCRSKRMNPNDGGILILRGEDNSDGKKLFSPTPNTSDAHSR